MVDVPWPDEAACREPDVDPELFFPFSEAGPGARQVAAAKAVCARCPVAAQCLDWALRAGEPAGVWGGTTPGERRVLRRSRYEAAGRWPARAPALGRPGAIAS